MTEQAKNTLYSRVKTVWRREQLLRFTQGIIACGRWGVTMFLAAVLIDWLVKIPTPGRVGLLAAVVGVTFYKAWHAGWKYLRPFNATRTALQIEAQDGGMESLIVTAVQFRDAAGRGATSKTLCEQTCRKAEDTAATIRAENVVRFRPLRRPAVLALIAIVVLGILSAMRGPLLMTGVTRIFNPWSSVLYPTRTQLKLASGDLVVQEGTPVRIAARVSGVVPSKAEIALRTGKGRPRVRRLPVVDGECEYRIETVFRGFDYRIIAGDARSRWHSVEVIFPPNIEHAEVRLNYPEYTERSPETVEGLTLTVPETTRIQWTLSLDRAVSAATVNLAGRDSVNMEVSPDGRQVTFEQTAAESRAYNFSWVERKHGFAFDSPSYYLQVAPDRPPHVELTSPKRNLYATLDRKLDLAFRGRDDHGIAESFVVYNVDKIEEQKVPFKPAKPIDGSEQSIDWDYRSALPELSVGQTVTFAVEVTDHYPGASGPHRVRSENRRIQFVTREDYLAQLAKQKKRLLSRLRTIYREERDVYEVVMEFDPAAPVFVQNCQLEAVRQDLMRERLNKLAGRMHDLTKDLAANGITDESVTKSLAQLQSDVREISSEHVAQAATALRNLASKSRTDDDSSVGVSGIAHAAHLVDNSARELGLLVLQLGYEDASDVMAREMHAAAQTQAALRLRTIMPAGKATEVAEAQNRLRKWLARLFEASPSEKESTIEEALVEFTLTRLVKRLINSGVETKLAKAAALIREGDSEPAARRQAEVIQALLKAEFRLRVGAEREALAEAMDLFQSQTRDQEKLRRQIQEIAPEKFGESQAELAQAQTDLYKNLQLLLMPEIPPRRPRLFDNVLPAPPPVTDLLATADNATVRAVSLIETGKPEAAVKEQRKAENAFATLAEIVKQRIIALTEAVRIQRLAYSSSKVDERLDLFGERQLSLLEKAEDAAADGTKSDYLADQEEALADAAEELRMELMDRAQGTVSSNLNSRSLPIRIDAAGRSMRQAASLLATNKPGAAANLQEKAHSALTEARDLLAEHSDNLSAYASMLASMETAIEPSTYVREIEAEQRDMLETTRQTKPENLPSLALPQKNLIHAVDAILVALDPISHLVETGTVMLFAKADMDAAATALDEKDQAEALDAQKYIVETLQELRQRIDAVVPQYHYLLEMIEALHANIQTGIVIREDQRRLREKLIAKADATGLAKKQEALKKRAATYGELIEKIAGLAHTENAVAYMAAAQRALETGDQPVAVEKMAMAEQALKAGTTEILALMKHLGVVLTPPGGLKEPPDEIQLLKEVLALAARQKSVYRERCAAKPDSLSEYESKLREFAKACIPFIKRAKKHEYPVADDAGTRPGKNDAATETSPTPPKLHRNLVQAKAHLANSVSQCAASDHEKAVASQKEAAKNLRHFVSLYALIFVNPPGPPPPGEPGISTTFNETEDTMQLFMPGAVTGEKPPDGRLDWEVLGKRDRAALNENFARELPLEYRAILKDYYERLTRQ